MVRSARMSRRDASRSWYTVSLVSSVMDVFSPFAGVESRLTLPSPGTPGNPGGMVGWGGTSPNFAASPKTPSGAATAGLTHPGAPHRK